MKDIFLCRTAKDLFSGYFTGLKPSEKKGAHQRLAKAMNIFPSYLSLLMKGDRTLNHDQGLLLAEYLGLKKNERRYLFRVIDLERAKTKKLKEIITEELDEMSKKDHQISSVIDKENLELTTDELLTFFSSWEYSVVHLSAALNDGYVSLSEIAKLYKIEKERLREIVTFLLDTRLWIKNESRIELGNRKIHLPNDSKLISKLHANWRLKAMSAHPSLNKENELAYSVAVALSHKDVIKVKSKILEMIKEVRNITDPSDSETIYFLNLDWIKA